ncbi:MAG TPA: hypothetical protein DCP32_12125 [Anaerolineaceae bacterium]|nr:MAG: hypothetical protein A2X24_06955 [Chloroflexi bacterium GWB2_54_36]HAL17455.1 hypothetical protein [Anaerolineaceae bacterium]HBA90506.1 hypothetical protein [Anaerolineaceae bacterium]
MNFEYPPHGELFSLFRQLKTPPDIQLYLDSLPYIGEELNRSPLRVMRDRQCHCLDGALLAALALEQLGFAARIIDLVPEPETDDDHVLAIFQINDYYGAVAKSNFVGLRYREPIYRSLRELAMSYFEVFFNIKRQKTLRAYTRPLNLAHYDRFDWQATETGVEKVVHALYSLKPVALVDAAQIAGLSLVDKRSYEAGMLGTNLDGLYKPAQG